MTEDMFTRNAAVSGWKPRTFDDDAQSVRVVAVTENPVRIWDWERKGFINEILLIDGATLSDSGRIPLLDSHNRTSINGVLGSARNFHKNGDTLEAEVVFSETDAGRNAALNVRDGHLTDFSVGYHPIEAVYLAAGETKEIDGRTFQGPAKVTSKWRLRELSVTAIGADRAATARSLDGRDADASNGRPDGANGEDNAPLAPDPPEPVNGTGASPPEDDGRGQRSAAEAETRSASKKPASLVDMIFYILATFMVLAFLRGLF
jgi:hypothetical protein